MNTLVKKIQGLNWSTLSLAVFALFMVLAPESAFAAAADIKQIAQDQLFRSAVTLGFGIYAFIKWIDYVSGLSTNNALTTIFVPGIMTFLAFKWTTVLSWFNLA